MSKNIKAPDEEALLKLFATAGPDTTVPPGTRERVFQRVLAEIEQGPRVAASPPCQAWRTRAWALRIGSAAAAIVLVAMAGWWLIWGGTPSASASFSQMIQNVCHASNMSWDHIVRYPGEPEHRTHTIYGSNRRVRVEWDDGTTQIERQAEMKGLKIRPAKKTASVIRYPRKYWTGGEPLDDLKMADAASARPVGKEIIDGRQAAIYELDYPTEVMRVWMDIEQKLPVRVEIKSREPVEQQSVVIMEHIRWNQDIPDSLFSVDIPAGYTKIELPVPSEEYLVKAFKLCAELSNGSFPPEFDSGRFAVFFNAHKPELKHFMPEHDGIPGLSREPDEATKEQARTCIVGSQFMDEIQESAQWHYFGPSVKYGDSKAILLCWRHKDAANWRVIYGDLSVKDVSPDQLPPMPASSPQGLGK